MSWKTDFPIFKTYPELVYLDSAATGQKPQAVIDALLNFYTKSNANVHRGIYELSEQATQAYEAARATVAEFLQVKPEEIIFTAGTTAATNLIAHSYLRAVTQAGDILISSIYEHHSNFLPLQELAKTQGAEVKLITLTAAADLDYNLLAEILRANGPRVKAVALAAVSNVLGLKLDINRVSRLIKQYATNAILIIDAAQMVGHHTFHPAKLGCDFACFSGHKLLAATGVGVLWGKKELLEKLAPYQVGGGMIDYVTPTQTNYAAVPERFEAGTPHIAGAVSVAAAINYIEQIGLSEIESYLDQLTEKLLTELKTIPEIRILGPQTTKLRSSVVSFSLTGIHPHDVSQYLSDQNIAVRAGHHCAQILHQQVFHLHGSLRASLHLYNEAQDIAKLITALKGCLTYYNKLKHGQ